MQMTKINHMTEAGSQAISMSTEGKTSCGIEFVVTTNTDEDGVLIDARLDITTPAAFIVVLQNLTNEQVDELADKLNSEYSYNTGDCVTLKIPGSKFDCIFINSSVIKEHPLGYNIVEKEYGTTDGHEVEICDVLIDYISSIRTTSDPSNHDEYVGFSIVYDTEILPDDECINIIESCDIIKSESDIHELDLRIVGMTDDLLESELYVRRGFSYEDITFVFHHMREEKRHMATGVAN